MNLVCDTEFYYQFLINTIFSALCPKGFKYNAGKCYYSAGVKEHTNFEDANKQCKKINIDSELLSIHSFKEQMFVQGKV